MLLNFREIGESEVFLAYLNVLLEYYVDVVIIYVIADSGFV